MFFDFPGHDESSWKAEYRDPISGNLPRSYSGAAKIYAHPLIVAVPGTGKESQTYEFAIQYWFFYPFNDGGNNHEGDWEHLSPSG